MFLPGSDVPIVGNVSDECENVSEAIVNFKIDPGNNPCGSVTDNNNGTYNCTFNTVGIGVGWKNVTMNANKSYYVNNSYFKENSFQIRNSSVLSNEFVSPDTEGWGYNYSISINAQDSDENDVINISLWKSVGGGPWEYVDSQNCTDCGSTKTKTFYKVFHCSDYYNGPIVNLKFNSTDNYGLTSESNNLTITFQQDNVTFTIVQGNGVEINRESGSQNFIVTAKDSDKQGSPSVNVTEESSVGGGSIDGIFWFETDGIGNFDEGHPEQITSGNGQMNHSFDPNCSYKVGSEHWYAEIKDNICYANTQMNPNTQTYELKGKLYTGLYQPVEKSEFNVSNPVNFRCKCFFRLLWTGR